MRTFLKKEKKQIQTKRGIIGPIIDKEKEEVER